MVLFLVLNQNAFQYICNAAEDAKTKLIQAATLKCCSSYVIVHREGKGCAEILPVADIKMLFADQGNVVEQLLCF